MPLEAVCPLGNIPGAGMGMGQGLGQNAGLHLGAGGGLLSCPAGSGLLPGLHAQGGMAKGITAALGTGAAASPSPSAAAKAAMATTVGVGGKGLSLGLGIGLGLWGPVLLAAASAAGAVYFWQRFHDGKGPTEEDLELSEAVASR